MKVTHQSEVGAVRRMVVKRPLDAFRSSEFINEQWQALNYEAPPDLESAIEEHEAFCRILQDNGVELHYLPSAPDTGIDSLYVRDAAIVCDKGAILCKMGKSMRSGEPEAQESMFRNLGIAILGSISGNE